MQVPVWMWLLFAGVVALLLAVDLFVHRGERGGTQRSAAIWSALWVGVGLAFAAVVWKVLDARAAQDYLAAYLIEKSLSLDNLFVFLVIFESLQITPSAQKTALTWGILGAVLFRALFVFLGIAAIERWHFVVYVFAAILLYAAYRIAREDPAEKKENKAVRWLEKHLPVTSRQPHADFVARVGGRLVATPLFISVVAIELTDIAFAVDSVPAALAVSREPFIVYSSNIFAILGLRALYLVLAHTLRRLRYLHYGLAVVLGFAAAKMILSEWLQIPPLLSVSFIVVVVGIAVVASVAHDRRAAPAADPRKGARPPHPEQQAAE